MQFCQAMISGLGNRKEKTLEVVWGRKPVDSDSNSMRNGNDSVDTHQWNTNH